MIGRLLYRIKQEIQSFDVADVLPKLIGWFPAIPSVMTNQIASYKPHHFNIKDGGNLVLSLWYCFLADQIIKLI